MSNASPLPSIGLLHTPTDFPRRDADLTAATRRLAGVLGWFDVPGVIVRTHHGPRVDSFEVLLAEATTQSELDTLGPRLARALDVESAVADLFPGGGVRIQISHDAPQQVSLRALLESDEFQHSKPTLSGALGRTAEGAVQTADLSVMPHLLIGGAPHTGKHTFLKALLTTLLLRCRPTNVRLLLVDSTGSACGHFLGIPHLLAPVLTEPFHALHALRWAVGEMERRYRRLAAAGARNIHRYNEGSTTTPKGAG